MSSQLSHQGSPPASCWCGGGIKVNTELSTGHFIYRCRDSQFHDPLATGDPAEITKLYLAGPMSGIKDCNYPLFNRYAERLRASGWEVVNPAEFGEGAHYIDFLREDLRLMLDCHGVATLDNWWLSSGARNEVMVAGLLRMPVRPAEQWFFRSPERI